MVVLILIRLKKNKQKGEQDSIKESKKLSRRGKVIMVYCMILLGIVFIYIYNVNIKKKFRITVTIDHVRGKNRKYAYS